MDEFNYIPRSNSICGAFNKPKLLFGISDRIAVPLWLITVGMVLVMGIYLMLPVTLALHYFLRFQFKRDPHMIEIYDLYRKEGDIYDPWPSISSKVKRPDGFGRDLLC
jgi:type IV secretory pathway VirB3-like protein